MLVSLEWAVGVVDLVAVKRPGCLISGRPFVLGSVVVVPVLWWPLTMTKVTLQMTRVVVTMKGSFRRLLT